jgi:hypothetical protein
MSLVALQNHLADLNNRLPNLNQGRQEQYYLMDTLPRCREWQEATKANVGKRGGNNPELLTIDQLLTTCETALARGARAKAIRDIIGVIASWRLRKGPGANTSERRPAIDLLDQIAQLLNQHVLFDYNAWLVRLAVPAAGTDRVQGGFGELGPTVESLRWSLITEIALQKDFDTMLEADSNILDSYGLRPGADFSGGAACYSAAEWVTNNIKGTVTRWSGQTYTLTALRVQKNLTGTHRFAIDANNVIVDGTWRQFFRNLLRMNTPAIFIGTPDELGQIVANNGGNADKVTSMYRH